MPNRRYAKQQLSILWKEFQINSKPLTCLMIDADYFKNVNYTHGHAIGVAEKTSDMLGYEALIKVAD